MSKGLEMMMKSFGFDPAAIKEQVEKAGADFKLVVQHFNTRMDKVDADNKRIEDKLDYLISCLKPVDVLVNQNATITNPSAKSHNGVAPISGEVQNAQ